MIVHTFDADGQAVLYCTASSGWNGNVLDPTIAAISVNDVQATVTGVSDAEEEANS